MMALPIFQASGLESNIYHNDSTASPSSLIDPYREPSSSIVVAEAKKTSSHRTQGAFVAKLFTMVQALELDHVIRWTNDGNRFSIQSPSEFSLILPQFFKHNNPQSFIRQLNIYNFHKVQYSGNILDHSSDGPWEFEHPSFRRDLPHLLPMVKRQSRNPVSGPATSARGTRGIQSRRRSTSVAGESMSSPEPEPEPEPEHSNVDYRTSHAAQTLDNMSQPRPSPPSRFGPLPPKTFYPSVPPPREDRDFWNGLADYPVKRQIMMLETKVLLLSVTLQGSQQDSTIQRAAMASAIRQLLSVVSQLDVNREHQAEFEAAASALAALGEVPSACLSTASPRSVIERPVGARSTFSDAERPNGSHLSPSNYTNFLPSGVIPTQHQYESKCSGDRRGRLPPVSSLLREREDTSEDDGGRKKPRH